MIASKGGVAPEDYKVFCFNGEPKLFQVIQGDKTPEETIDCFDTEWNLLPIKQNLKRGRHG